MKTMCFYSRINRKFVGLIVCGLGIGLVPQLVFAQSPGDTRSRYSTPPTPSFHYFAGGAPTPVASRPVRDAVPQPQQAQNAGSKPFQHIQHGPVISPYLSLDYIESGTGLPNYYAFTRPMLEQNRTNEVQAREIRKLKHQLRTSTAKGIVSKNPGAGVPTTGSSIQFQNLGSFYPGLR